MDDKNANNNPAKPNNNNDPGLNPQEPSSPQSQPDVKDDPNQTESMSPDAAGQSSGSGAAPQPGETTTPASGGQNDEIGTSGGPDETPPPNTNYELPVNEPKSGKKWLKALIVLVVLALLALAGWLLYTQLNKEDDTQTVNENKDIQQLNVGLVSADYGELYPNMAPNSYSYLANAQIFEGLVRYEDTSQIVPLLATDWTNPNDRTWVFNIKDGVTFHNGNEMSAEDVKYSIETVQAQESDFADIFTSSIESVEVVDSDQVRIVTSSPDPTLLNKLAFLYVIDDESEQAAEPSTAGTGPYMVRPNTEPSSTEIQMVAYDEYHGPSPTTKAVTLGSEDSVDALLEAYNAGEFNIIGNIPTDRAEEFSGANQFVTSEPEVAYLGLNSVSEGSLQNKNVREAIRYAVDPVLLGQAEGDRVTPLSQLIPESIPGHNNAIEPYERDVQRAQELLQEAGYEDGVTIEFSHTDNEEIAEELTRQLGEAGIELEVDAQESFNDFISYFSGGQAEMYYVIYASDILDGLDMYNTTLASTPNYENEELSNILNDAEQTIDPAERLELLQEAALIIDEDVAIIPLSTQDNIWLMDQDYQITQDMPSSFLSVYFSKVQLK